MGNRLKLPHREYEAAREKMNQLIELRPSALTSFEMFRGDDETGVSGVGKVLEGIIFSSGAVSIHWCRDLWSVTYFQDWQTFVKIHVGSHPANKTSLVFHPSNRELPSWEWQQ